MIEYKTFDDYVRCIFKIEPTELTHISPEEQKKKTVKITADELINIWNELAVLKAQIEKMKCCMNCTFFRPVGSKEKWNPLCKSVRDSNKKCCNFYKMGDEIMDLEES
jgi:hypothetical protein